MPVGSTTQDTYGNIVTANVRTRDDEPYIISPSAYRDHSTPVHTYDPSSPGRYTLGNSTSPLVIPVPAQYHDRLTNFTVNILKASDASNTITARLERSNGTNGAVTTVASQTNNANAPGAVALTPASPFTEDVDGTVAYHILVWNSTASPSAPDRVFFTLVNKCSTLG